MSYCLEEIIDVNGQSLHFASKAGLMCQIHHHQPTQRARLMASQPCQLDDSTVVSLIAGGFCKCAGIQIVCGKDGSTGPGFGFSPWHFVPAATMLGSHPASLFSSSIPILPTDGDKASINKPLLIGGRGSMNNHQIQQQRSGEMQMQQSNQGDDGGKGQH
jgi:hypothetical protein